jgi:hypothetical protein
MDGTAPEPRPQRPLPLRILRAIGRAIVTVVVVVYTLLDDVLFPLLRPLLRWLGRLRVFETIGATIARLPPYVVLVLFAVPFVIIEPVKVFALYWGAVGHPVQGLILLGIAQVASILICERIYHVGQGQLLRIGWFARLMGWIFRLRDRAFAWAKSTAAWRAAAATARSIRLWFAGVLASMRP